MKPFCKRMALKALHVITVTLLLVQQTPATIAGSSDSYGAKPAQTLSSGDHMMDLTPLGPLAAPAASQALGTCAQTLTAGTGRISGRSQLIGEILDAGSGLSVYPGSGAVIYDGIDLSIHNQGPALRAALSYDSLYRQDDTGWGYGWTFNFDWHYEVEEDGVVLWLERSGLFFEDDGLGGFISPSQYITMTRQGDSLIVDWSSDKRLTFDSPVHKRITRWEEGEGSALTFAYDGDGQLQHIQSESGRQIDVAFQDDRLHTLTDEGVTPARRLQLDYNAAGDLVTVTHTLDQVTQLRYDAGHRLIGLTDPRGTETVFAYDGDYVTQFARGDMTTRWTIDEEAGTITVEELTPGQAPRQWVYAHDYRGMLESTTYPDGSVTRQVLDEVQNEWRTTDENGHASTIIMADDRLTASRDPLGHTTTYTYHPTTGNMSGMTDPLGHTTAYEYDGEGHLTAMVDPQGGRWSYEYGSTGRVTHVTDPLSRTTDMGYDDSGHLAVMTDSLGIPTHMAYDPAGRLVATTDGNGHTIRVDYDGLDRPVVITDALGYATMLAYDNGDNPVRVTDPNGNSTRMAYDQLGQAHVVTDALGSTVQMGYDAWGNLAALTDERGHTTSYQYDTRDRLIAQTDPLSQTTHYRYDGVGNRIGTTDARGRVITYTYDAADRLTAVDYAGSDDDVYTFYDPAGQVTAAGDADVEVQYDYDAAGRVVTTSYIYDGVPFAPLDMTHGYNLAGQVITSTLPGGETVHYAYDGAARLAEVRGHGTRHTLTYDGGGRLTQVAPPAGSPGARSTYGYDAADQITALNNTSPDGSVVFDTFNYEYGPTGNVLTAAHNGETIGYDYDGVYRLTGVDYADGDWEQYTYDPAGNRLALETPGGMTQYEYDAANQLVTLTDTLGVATAFAYDANGNLTHRSRQGGTIAYTWDGADRLTRIDYPDDTFIAYTYGPESRRLSRRGRDGNMIYYVYDGLNLVEERDAAGNALANYVYGRGLDRPYSMRRDGQTYFYLYDRQGSVVGLTDGAGIQVARYEYDAWGNLLNESGAVENPFRYTGREWDAEAGLYYLRARYYDPALGRFLSRDPLGMVDGTNVYVYVHNNPLNRTDRSGTLSSCACRCFNNCFEPFASSKYRNIVSGLVTLLDVASSAKLAWTLISKGDVLTNLANANWKDLFDTIMMAIDVTERVNALLPHKDACGRASRDGALAVLSAISTVNTAIAAAQWGLATSPAGFVLSLAMVTVLLEHATATVMKVGECIIQGSYCEDTGPPAIWVGDHICDASRDEDSYVVQASDDCGLTAVSVVIGGPQDIRSESFQDPPYAWEDRFEAGPVQGYALAWDEANNSREGTIPACDQNCHAKPECSGECEKAEWSQSKCEWWCFDHGITKTEEECKQIGKCWAPTPECGRGCKLSVIKNGVLSPTLWTDKSGKKCGENHCGEPVYYTWNNNACEWDCAEPESSSCCPEGKPEICGRNRCGGVTYQTWDSKTCQWKCPPTGSNNPCLPDDNRSPAGLERLTTAPSLKSASHIAILDNGFAISMQDFLAQQSIATERIGADFSPEMVDRYPVLLIPSGGLNGYAGSESMRLRLSRYVENGGTLIVFAQVHGNEFRLLPGGNAGVRGYGWDEDVNCHGNSAYISTFHPALAGQYRDLLSLNIDGFFTHWPQNAEVLLGRVANGMPAMLTYPYGAGRVVATTAYADMAHYQGQGTNDEATLLRDLIRWAESPNPAMESYGPDDTLTVPLTVTNHTTMTVAHLRYYLFTPHGPPVAEPGVITLTTALAPDASVSVTSTVNLGDLTLPEEQRYGLWTVEVELLDHAGYAVQLEANAYRFAVTRFAQQPGGGHGYQGKPYAMSVTSASESYPYGSSVAFTFHVFNNSDVAGDFQVSWGLPHHGLGWDRHLWRDISVPAHGSATFDYTLEDVRDLDRLRAYLYLDGQAVAHAERGFWAVKASHTQTIVTDKTQYEWMEQPEVTVTTVLDAVTPVSMTIDVVAQAPDGQTLLTDVLDLALTPGTPHVYTMTLPPLQQAGYTEVVVTTRYNRATYHTSKKVYLPPAQINVTSELPVRLEAGAPLTLTVANTGGGVARAPVVQLSVADPLGIVVWSGTQALATLEPGQATTTKFVLGDLGPTLLGVYTLDYVVTDGGVPIGQGTRPLPATPVVEVDFDRPFYRVRETVRLTATLHNPGRFDLSPAVTMTLPELGLTRTQTLALPAAGEAGLSLTFTLPVSTPMGVHAAQIMVGQGTTIEQAFPFIIPPPSLEVSLEPGLYRVGEPLTVTLTNLGGINAVAGYTLQLHDLDRVMATRAATCTVQAGGQTAVTLTLPLDLAQQAYTLQMYVERQTDQELQKVKLLDKRVLIKVDKSAFSKDRIAQYDVASAACPPLGPPTGNVITVTTETELWNAVRTAITGTTILIADGTYNLGENEHLLWITAPGITLRSASGNRDAVILDDNYSYHTIINVVASDVTIADLTIKRPYNHAIHVTATNDEDTLNTRIYNVHIVDAGEQAIKINPYSGRVHFPDNGVIACSHIELTDEGRPHIRGNCQTGGVNASYARDWVFRDNLVEGFWCEQNLSGYGVIFMDGSRDTVIERNVFIDNARTLGLGMFKNGGGRTYPDNPCPSAGDQVDHYGGVVRNNFVFAGRDELFASQSGFDTGIALWETCGATVLHNTVASTQAPFSSIEWRYSHTDIDLINNLVTHNLMARDGAQANQVRNLENQPLSVFADGAGGDLHLTLTATVAIDQGATVVPGLCDDDADGDLRPIGIARDIGADEYWDRGLNNVDLWRIINVEGVVGDVAVHTDKNGYLDDETIMVQGMVTVTGGSLSGTLNLRVTQVSTMTNPGGADLENTLWQERITVSPTATQTISATVGTLAPGRYYLVTELQSGILQTLTRTRKPFYVFAPGTALTLETDRSLYRSDQTILVSGWVTNTALTTDTLTLTVTANARAVLTRTFELASGEGTEYTTVLTSTENVHLIATAGQARAAGWAWVSSPQVEASLIAPDVVGHAPFSVTLAVTNTGPVSVSLLADFGQVARTLVLDSDEQQVLQASLVITDDRSLHVTLSGGVALTLTREITQGEVVAFTSAGPTSPTLPLAVMAGSAGIPYTLTNVGLLPATTPLTFTLDSVEVFSAQIATLPGQVYTGSVRVDLAPGVYTLTQQFGTERHTVLLRAYAVTETHLSLDNVQTPAQIVGPTSLTVTLSNPGLGTVDGSLQVRADFLLLNVPVTLDPGETRELTVTLDAGGELASGSYTLTVETWVNGILGDQVQKMVEILAAELGLSLPPLTLFPSELNPITVTMRNAGGVGSPFTFTLDLDGLATYEEQGWLGPGKTITEVYRINLPADLETRIGVGHYTINGAQTFFTYTIAGYQLDMSARLSPRVAAPGEAVTATLLVTDTSGLGAPIPLWVRLGGVGEPQTIPITLTNTLAVSFIITTPMQDALLSYGIYHPQGRSLLLDTMRLYVQNDLLRVYPGRDRYTAGDTLVLTAIADVPGTIVWQTLGVSQTMVLSPGLPFHWALPLPDDILAGTTYADYYFEPSDDVDAWIAGQVAFDVEGERVEIHRILAQRQVADRQIISPTLQLRSRTSLDDVAVSGAVIGPDGTVMDATMTMVDMTAGLQWVELPALAFTPTHAGPHRVECRLSQGGRELAFGWEGFDVAGPTVLGVHTSQAYHLPARPITATVTSSNSGDLPATLSVALDGAVIEQVSLPDPGYHVTSIDLGPLAEGTYTLTARLEDESGLLGELAARVYVVSPRVQVDVSPPDGLAGWHTTTPDVQLQTDFPDGVIVYQWDEEDVRRLSDVWTGVPESDGQHDMAAWVEIPGVGAGPVTTATLWLDRASPAVTASVEMGTPITLTLSAADDVSGVSRIRYHTGDSEWETYTSPVAFTEAQTTTVLYQSRDQAGNHSPVDHINVPPLSHPYGLALEVGTTQQDGPPGGLVAYTLGVVNAGYATDRYTVTVTGGDWPVRSIDMVGPLGEGQSASLVVVVDVPSDAASGSSDVAWVTVTSLGDPAQVETRQLTTTARVLAGVNVTAGRPWRTGSSGGRVSYRLRVTNQGNVADTFDLGLGRHTWPVTASLTVGPLAAGESADLDVIVKVPDSAAPGETDAVEVSVVSHVDPAQSASVELITTISCVPASSIGFTYWPSEPQVEEAVYFTATTVAGTPPVDYAWHFGDGQTSTGQFVSHTYAVTGSYQVTAIATNCGGACVTTSTATLIVGGDQPLRHIYLPVVLKAWYPKD